MLQPWTVDAWIAFLDLVVEFLSIVVWPAVTIGALSIFKQPISDLITRIRRLHAGGADIDPIVQTQEREENPLLQLQDANFGELEEQLEPWLTPIRAELQREGMGLEQDTVNRLMLGLAISQRRAEFFDIWRRIVGSQAELLIQLNRAHQLSAPSIQEYHAKHRGRTEGTGMAMDDWLSFLQYYRLVLGDRNELQMSIYGQQFVEFIETEGLSVSTKLY